MNATTITLAVFSGTGNSLIAAKALAERLREAGKTVRIVPMDYPERLSRTDFPDGCAVGFVMPVACFTSYPTVWRFVDSLPPGEGREAFLLATMGGMAGGMAGPIGRRLKRKGYRPLGTTAIPFCGNYGAELPSEIEFLRLADAVQEKAAAFAGDLMDGRAVWSLGRSNLLATVLARLGRRRTTFRLFRRFFPLDIDQDSCIQCGLCRDWCPEGNVTEKNGRFVFQNRCQSCQRCAGFCPTHAIRVKGKNNPQYRAVTVEEFRAFLEDGMK